MIVLEKIYFNLSNSRNTSLSGVRSKLRFVGTNGFSVFPQKLTLKFNSISITATLTCNNPNRFPETIIKIKL